VRRTTIRRRLPVRWWLESSLTVPYRQGDPVTAFIGVVSETWPRWTEPRSTRPAMPRWRDAIRTADIGSWVAFIERPNRPTYRRPTRFLDPGPATI